MLFPHFVGGAGTIRSTRRAYRIGQLLNFLIIFLLSGHYLLSLSLTATDDADDVSRVRFQLANILLFTLRKQRRCRNHQNPHDH